ncbi:phage holin family protein [Caloramator proteoclasticus]|uniref:Toxin secretion/phage lysis holin n=1 Tax=Caloramator proteoclasticus DSM 10124 TaxID=1121262 RepID=A0A1M4ZDF2_9CLOT|nr:phage holin family protein [Caloramator proteoclasticus]SHF16083.1 toxin secretion/phage lysis holin [Caloramator proteoclasticus DSM 10124]
MKNNHLQLIFATIGGYLGYFLGGFDGFMYALLIFMVIDYVTGVMVAILEGRLSSAIGFRGLFKKILILIMVGIGNIIDKNVLNNGNAIRTAVIFFYMSNEGISIIENSAKIGLPVPKKLTEALEQINKEGEN